MVLPLLRPRHPMQLRQPLRVLACLMRDVDVDVDVDDDDIDIELS
jgi:hypothetical protein